MDRCQGTSYDYPQLQTIPWPQIMCHYAGASSAGLKPITTHNWQPLCWCTHTYDSSPSPLFHFINIRATCSHTLRQRGRQVIKMYERRSRLNLRLCVAPACMCVCGVPVVERHIHHPKTPSLIRFLLSLSTANKHTRRARN
jgi:hypothetical protein